MKKLFLILIAGFICNDVKAQHGFYLSSSIGIGFVNSNAQNISYSNLADHTVTRNGLIRGNAAIHAGYHFNRWCIQSNLQFLNTGFELEHSRSGEYYHREYYHIGIGLQAGYNLNPGKRLGVVPQIGLMTTANFNGPAPATAYSAIVDRHYKDQYEKISIWLHTILQFEYHLNNRVSITGGPSLLYTLNKFQKQEVDFPAKDDNKRNYAANVDLGVKINL